MLANVLNSDWAIQASVRIVEIYIKMRENILTNKELLLKMEQLEKRVGIQDEKIVMIFKYLKKFVEDKNNPGNAWATEDPPKRIKIPLHTLLSL